jgi:hypothetical protein
MAQIFIIGKSINDRLPGNPAVGGAVPAARFVINYLGTKCPESGKSILFSHCKFSFEHLASFSYDKCLLTTSERLCYNGPFWKTSHLKNIIFPLALLPIFLVWFLVPGFLLLIFYFKFCLLPFDL